MPRRLQALVWCVLSLLVPHRAAAQDPAPDAVRVVLPFRELPACARIDLRAIEETYFSEPDALRSVTDNLAACGVRAAKDGYVVMLFAVSPTRGAESPTVVRTILQNVGSTETPQWRAVGGMTGAAAADWLYLTRDSCDVVKGELLASKVPNPAIAQIGPFIAALIEKAPFTFKSVPTTRVSPGANPCPPPGASAHLHLARNVPLIHKRGSINETVYIERIRRSGSQFVDAEGKPTADFSEATYGQLAETSAFANTPLSTITFNTGVAIFTGPMGGAKAMAVDSGQFVSSPVSRAATIAGVTLHKKFDSTLSEPSTAERQGVLIGGILTPAPGVAGGYTYGWRAFAVFIGGGVIWVNTAPANDRVNTAVASQEGLELRPAYGLLLGGTYVFGG